MPRTSDSLFGLRRSLFCYHNSQSTSMSSSLSSISELSGAASSTSDSVTSANGLVAQEAVLYDKIDPPLGNESDHLQIRQEPQ